MVASIDAPEKLVGKPIKRREDPRLITGAGQFIDDLRLPGLLHLGLVRSPLGAREDQEHRSFSGPCDARGRGRVHRRRLHGSQSAAGGLAGGWRHEQRGHAARAGGQRGAPGWRPRRGGGCGKPVPRARRGPGRAGRVRGAARRRRRQKGDRRRRSPASRRSAEQHRARMVVRQGRGHRRQGAGRVRCLPRACTSSISG